MSIQSALESLADNQAADMDELVILRAEVERLQAEQEADEDRYTEARACMQEALEDLDSIRRANKTGNALRDLRTAAGLSMGDLARVLKTDAATISALEMGTYELSAEEKAAKRERMIVLNAAMHPGGHSADDECFDVPDYTAADPTEPVELSPTVKEAIERRRERDAKLAPVLARIFGNNEEGER